MRITIVALLMLAVVAGAEAGEITIKKARITNYSLRECPANHGITSSGKHAVSGRTVALSRDLYRRGIPHHANVYINGYRFKAEDKTAEFVLKGNKKMFLMNTVDIFLNKSQKFMFYTDIIIRW